MEWWQEVAVQVVAGIILLLVGAVAGTVVTRRRVRREASEWTLEHIADDRWTLRRDSASRALETWVWPGDDNPDLAEETRVKFGGWGRTKPDFNRGDVREIHNLKVGNVLQLGWIENDTRLEAKVLTRASTPKMTISRNDLRRTSW